MCKIYLNDNSYLCYDRGSFDNWCVYEVNYNGTKKAPKDIEYFQELFEYSKILNKQQIYKDFVDIYNITSNKFNEEVVNKIKEISLRYGKLQNKIFRVFSIIYMGMIAEENKQNTKLGKRIKRLGVHYLLVEGQFPYYSANSTKKVSWKEIDFLCKKYGF